MIVTTDVPKVPPILVSANTIAALSGKAATTLLIIVYLTKFKNNFGHCRYDSNDYDVSHFVI